MNKTLKSLAASAAMLAGAAANPEKTELTEEEIKMMNRVCGDCKNCPDYPKTYCKTAKHQVTRATQARNCKQFEGKE